MYLLEIIIGSIIGVASTLIILIPYYTDVINKTSAKEYSEGYLDGLELKQFTNSSIKTSM